MDGLSICQIPFEENLLEHFQKTQPLVLILEKGGDAYGHVELEHLDASSHARFNFYDWNGMLKNTTVIDGLMTMLLEHFANAYPGVILYTETTAQDDYRNATNERAGWQVAESNPAINHPWSSKTIKKISWQYKLA